MMMTRRITIVPGIPNLTMYFVGNVTVTKSPLDTTDTALKFRFISGSLAPPASTSVGLVILTTTEQLSLSFALRLESLYLALRETTKNL